MTIETTHPCQVCGKCYQPSLLFDLKGSVPGGCKVMCLECVGRLEEREAILSIVRAIAEQKRSYRDNYPLLTCEEILAAIRARSPAQWHCPECGRGRGEPHTAACSNRRCEWCGHPVGGHFQTGCTQCGCMRY